MVVLAAGWFAGDAAGGRRLERWAGWGVAGVVAVGGQGGLRGRAVVGQAVQQVSCGAALVEGLAAGQSRQLGAEVICGGVGLFEGGGQQRPGRVVEDPLPVGQLAGQLPPAVWRLGDGCWRDLLTGRPVRAVVGGRRG